MSAGHIITRGLIGGTMVTRGYGTNTFTALIYREILKLYSFIKTTLSIESNIEWRP